MVPTSNSQTGFCVCPLSHYLSKALSYQGSPHRHIKGGQFRPPFFFASGSNGRRSDEVLITREGGGEKDKGGQTRSCKAGGLGLRYLRFPSDVIRIGALHDQQIGTTLNSVVGPIGWSAATLHHGLVGQIRISFNRHKGTNKKRASKARLQPELRTQTVGHRMPTSATAEFARRATELETSQNTAGR